MDRTPQLMGRAIVATSLVVMIAIGGVFLHLWLRGPTRGRPVLRRHTPLLINEPDGSVYDLTFKLDALEGRLQSEERRSKEMASENGTLRRDNERLKSDLRAVQQEIARLRKQIAPKPQAESPPANTPAASPGPPVGPEPVPPP